MKSKSIRTKLFLLMTMIGVIPFLVAILFIAWQNVIYLEQHAKTTLWNRNIAVNDSLTQIFDKNFYVLRTLAYAPVIRNYLIEPASQDEAAILKIMHQTNDIFHDNNQIILTAANGMQMLRTDASPKVHIAQRKHFHEAMAGREYISDAMISTSTGGAVVVLETPVFNYQNKAIGLIHRNFYLDAVQDLIQAQHAEDTDILILDRDNNIIAHSERNENYTKGMNVTEGLQQFFAAANAEEGVVRMDLQGDSCLVAFSRNSGSGWGIVTIKPYSQIWASAHAAVFRGFILGLLLLLIVALMAYFLSDRLTRPIRKVSSMLANLASGRKEASDFSILADDEMGQIAQAVNEMRNVHTHVVKDVQTDSLTELYNINSIEEICRQKLQEYQEDPTYNGMVAIMVIDLDNFKKSNAESGHEYGNQVLKEFANRLRNIFPVKDSVGRIEGDEFIVILDHQPDAEAVTTKAENVIRAAQQLMINGESAEITASIGIALAPRSGKSYNHLLHAADLALFVAKEKGKNQYRLADQNY